MIPKDKYDVMKKLNIDMDIKNRVNIYLDSVLGLKAIEVYGRELCKSKFDIQGNRELFYRNDFMKKMFGVESDIKVDEKIKELYPEHASTRGKVNNYDNHSIYYKKKKNIKKSPAIIISSNGMCHNGPILEHLKAYLKDKDNIILLTGYQANHTNGYKLSKLKDMPEKQKKVDD